MNGWKRMSPEYLVCNTYLPILFWFFADTSLLMSSLDASVIKTFSSGGDLRVSDHFVYQGLAVLYWFDTGLVAGVPNRY